MRTTFIIILFTTIAYAIAYGNNPDYVLNKFSEVCKSINQLEYNIERVDTFSNGNARTIHGHVLIVKDNEDYKYGYQYSGVCYELNQQSIYDGRNSFDIDTKAKSYSLIKSLIGYPGNQLVKRIADMIFSPDNTYSDVLLQNETSDYYTIEYQFKDDPPYRNFRKKIVIDKKTFLPMEFVVSGQDHTGHFSHQFIISDLKVNENVSASIEKKKLELSTYTMIPPENDEKKESIVGSVAPNLLLSKLTNQSSMAEIYRGKLTLLDFWEVWCGYCIKSMPKIDSLSKKFSNQIDVIGIVTQDTVNAKKLVNKLGISFYSLIGNRYVLEKYGVKSYPHYFLIDKDGIVKKEYAGYSSEIEKDIMELLEK